MPAQPSLLPFLASVPVHTIDDVLAVMQRIDASLPNQDGLKWFNLLYLEVTRAVKQQSASGGWEDTGWLARLDVLFARLYFQAVTDWQQSPDSTSRSWKPLLQNRTRQDIQRIQFALAGMNAHINYDLALAIVQTCQERGTRPTRNSPQYRDYVKVNALLETVEAQVKQRLATGIIGEIDQHLGDSDDILAMWSVRRARETAWGNAEILWGMRRTRFLREAFLQNLGRLVGMAGRGLLVPIH